MWTQPVTEDQKRYFSKHAPKRRAYGIIQTILQLTHALVALAAWATIFGWCFQRFPVLQPVILPISFLSLVVLHWLLRVTWSTFWYDKLDNNDKTDSSVWIPLAIIVILFFVEVNGAKKFLVSNIKEPVAIRTDTVERDHSTTLSSFEQSYQSDVQRIGQVYGEKQRAAERRFDYKIRSWQNRQVDTEGERIARRAALVSLRQQRESAIAAVLDAKGSEMEKAMNRFTARKMSEEGRRDKAVASIDDANGEAKTGYDSSVQNAKGFAWLLSVVLIILIAGLGYARVRINVKSGILPLRDYTVLDAHGSFIERIFTAFGDAFNRRGLQFAVWIHKGLSPSKAITSFDGTVVAQPGKYNSPSSPSPIPVPDTDSYRIGEAYSKVFAKMRVIQEEHPGYLPNPEVIREELNKALKLNGTYAAADWNDPGLGK